MKFLAMLLGLAALAVPLSAMPVLANEPLVAQNASSADGYNARAIEKFKKNDVAGAIADMNLAIAAAPQEAQLYFNRGFIYKESKQYKEALADFNRAIELKPDFAEALASRAYLKQSQFQDYRGSLADYDRVLVLSPQSGEIFLERGMLKQQRLNDVRGALADYDKAIALGNRDPFTYSFRALAKRSLGDKAGAIADFQESSRLAAQKQDAAYKDLIRANQEQLQALGV